MTTTMPLTSPLMRSESRISSRGAEYVESFFQTYNIRTCAVYVDHTTVTEDVEALKLKTICGLYSFDINLVGLTVMGHPVKLLRLDGPIPDCDGWLVASTSRAAAFSLAEALRKTANENQVIVRFYGGQTTEISAYMDVFSGETETLMYLNHYYDRRYRILFPIDIRYKVYRKDGVVVKTGQRIVTPGALTILDTREMDLGDFEGFIRIELEVENLQVRVQPFIHFWADYISEAGMCRNHQSGWAPWPAGTVFNRGYLPLDPNKEAICSIYNANDTEVSPRALLHFNKDGKEESVERVLPAIGAGHMSFENLSKLFADVSLEGVEAAYILLSCDKPLHRPNYYIAVRGEKKIIDTYHQTGGRACHWTPPLPMLGRQEIELRERFGIEHPWTLQIPLLDKRFRIESYLGLLSLTICDITQFSWSFLNDKGKQVHCEDIDLDGSSQAFLNLSEMVSGRGIDTGAGGIFCLSPRKDLSEVPGGTAAFFGLKHREFAHVATSFRGANAEANLPFYITATTPHSREYQYSPLSTSDGFGPGTFSSEYDSLYLVMYQSLSKDYPEHTDYSVEIIDMDGKSYLLHRKIRPNTCDAFWLSEAIEQAGVKSGGPYFTVWVKCYHGKLKLYHSLYRKQDHALSFDDGSEGTLQRDPQIAGIEPHKVDNVFLQFLRETGVMSMIPQSLKDQVRQKIQGKPLGS